MIIVTQNSTYEFDSDQERYRKIKPSIGIWKTYHGFLMDPCIGNSLRIIRDANTLTTTSRITQIFGIEDE